MLARFKGVLRVVILLSHSSARHALRPQTPTMSMGVYRQRDATGDPSFATRPRRLFAILQLTIFHVLPLHRVRLVNVLFIRVRAPRSFLSVRVLERSVNAQHVRKTVERRGEQSSGGLEGRVSGRRRVRAGRRPLLSLSKLFRQLD